MMSHDNSGHVKSKPGYFEVDFMGLECDENSTYSLRSDRNGNIFWPIYTNFLKKFKQTNRKSVIEGFVTSTYRTFSIQVCIFLGLSKTPLCVSRKEEKREALIIIGI